MSKIQDKDRLYTFLRPYVDWMFRCSYRNFQCVGRENIPDDGAIIYAPNHTNALCDAMSVLGLDRGRKVFVARADIFKDPKKAKILTWLKIMPISRVRDGLDEVRHNDETIDKAVDTLRDGVPFCIFAEGTHHPDRTILPLSKGIFRIALQANERFGAEKPVYIVPVGLKYGDYYHLWDSLTIQIGEPINVTAFSLQHAEFSYPQMMMALREELSERLEALISQPSEVSPQMSAFSRWLFLILLSPLFVVSGLMTIPLWGAWLLIQKKVKDRAFHNSVMYVWQLIYLTITLLIPFPFWLFLQEYVYQWRKVKSERI